MGAPEGANSIISLNRIDSTGRQAISAGGDGVVIKNNVINYPCLNYNDCGGIMPRGNSAVDGNIIKNSYGYFPYFYDAMYSGGNGARGIYPDFQTGDVITNNTIVNTVLGIGLTNSKNEIIKNNTVYNSFVSMRMNRKDAGQLSNTITNNTFFGLHHKQFAVLWDNMVSDIDSNSILDSNRYWNPYSFYPLIKYRPDVNTAEGWYDLGQWQQAMNKDLNSKKEYIFKNQPYIITDTTGNSLVQNGLFNSGISGWTTGNNTNISVVGGQLDGPCLSVTYNGTTGKGSLFQHNIQTSPASFYLISFSLKGTQNIDGKPLEVTLRKTGGSTVYFYRAFKIQATRNEYWSIFKSSTNSLTLQFNAPSGTYYIDNVSILQVSVSWIDPESVFPIFINETSSPAMINLPSGTYLDLDSNLVGPSIILPPFSSMILVRIDSLTTGVNESASSQKFMLWQNYPNPFNPSTTIRFSLPQHEHVTLKVFDVLGREVATLLEGERDAGEHEVVFEATELPCGIYFAQLQSHLSTQQI
ncbi:MAG: T9SS type A sorting domain-containing protein, partial [Bacteroidota bacterium]